MSRQSGQPPRTVPLPVLAPLIVLGLSDVALGIVLVARGCTARAPGMAEGWAALLAAGFGAAALAAGALVAGAVLSVNRGAPERRLLIAAVIGLTPWWVVVDHLWPAHWRRPARIALVCFVDDPTHPRVGWRSDGALIQPPVFGHQYTRSRDHVFVLPDSAGQVRMVCGAPGGCRPESGSKSDLLETLRALPDCDSQR